MNKKRFFEQLREIVGWIRDANFQEIILVHHNDADGLSSGAILQSAFTREQKRVRRIALEKPYPQAITLIIESIDDCSKTLLLLTDFSSGMLPTIEAFRPSDLSVLVLDHHQIVDVQSNGLRIVNPIGFDISGRTECSASTVCYLFAKTLNEWNSDRAAIALVGIFGDGQYTAPHQTSGLNTLVFEDALTAGLISVSGEISLLGKQAYPLHRIVSAVNALGSIGYFSGGCDIAVKGLVDGWGIEVDTCGAEYQERYRQLSDKFIAQVKLQHQGELDWFVLDQSFQSVGVKTVGLLCEELIKKKIVTGERYILGVQSIEPRIPGIGPVVIDEDKVSMRVTPALLTRIERGEKRSLTEILPVATAAVGGFVDACHPHAAATTIKRGSLNQLIEEVFRIIA